MEKQSQILNNRPMVRLVMTRDSVCAGDDCDAPHESIKEIHSFLDPGCFANEASLGYLPIVAGNNHLWVCILNGKRIARISKSGAESLIERTPYADENHVHFKYQAATN